MIKKRFVCALLAAVLLVCVVCPALGEEEKRDSLLHDGIKQINILFGGIDGLHDEAFAFIMLAKEKNYHKALEKEQYAIENMDAYLLQEVIGLYELLGDYLDSAERREICRQALDEHRYQQALQYESERRYTEAAAIYDEIFHYRDAATRIYEIEQRYYTQVGEVGEGLLSVRKDGYCGYIDSKGEVVIPFQYSSARAFREGLAAVESNGKWGFINKKGEVVVPFGYADVFDFCNGFARVQINDYGSYGYVNAQGVQITPCKYRLADDFSYGYAAVNIESGYRDRGGFIDENGKEYFFPAHVDTYVGRFCDGVSLITTDRDGCYYIDLQGNRLNDTNYEYAYDFEAGRAEVVRYDGTRGLINTKGEWLMTLRREAYSECSGYGVMRPSYDNAKEFSILDEDGSILLTYGEVADYGVTPKVIEDGLIIYTNSSSGGYTNGVVDMDGNVLIPSGYWYRLNYMGNGWFDAQAFVGITFTVRDRCLYNVHTGMRIELSRENDHSCECRSLDGRMLVFENNYLTIYDMDGNIVY